MVEIRHEHPFGQSLSRSNPWLLFGAIALAIVAPLLLLFVIPIACVLALDCVAGASIRRPGVVTLGRGRLWGSRAPPLP
jgi:hypothetical protein